MHVTKTLVGVIDFGLPLDQAIALPNIYFGGGELQVEENTPLSARLEALAKYGQRVKAADLGSKVNGAQWTANGWTGASDPRSDGTSAVLDSKGKVTVTTPRPSVNAPTESVE